MSCEDTQNLGPIGSAVLTFIGCKQHTNRQTDRQAKYIYLDWEGKINWHVFFYLFTIVGPGRLHGSKPYPRIPDLWADAVLP